MDTEPRSRHCSLRSVPITKQQRVGLPSDYHTQLERFTSLRYLVVPMPALTLSETTESAAEWAPYETALSSVLTLPSLRAVRFLTFPEVLAGFFLNITNILNITNTDQQEKV